MYQTTIQELIKKIEVISNIELKLIELEIKINKIVENTTKI